MQLYEAAGLPPGVINMVLGSGREIGDAALAHPDLAGIHFTGSTAGVPAACGARSAQNIDRYRTYPRLVGETGGKDFIVAHPSADPAAVATAIVRGSFEYQGQKCSAASRVYAPSNLWPASCARCCGEQVSTIRTGDVRDFRNFMGAVIDGDSFATQRDAFELARDSPDAEVLVGGEADDSRGLLRLADGDRDDRPRLRPDAARAVRAVVTAYVYDEHRIDDTLDLVDRTSPYALTGAVFATDRRAIDHASDALRNAAGNFYVNDKPTGAVVGPAALRRRAGVGHQRQGGLDVEPDPLGQPAHDQGDVRPADRLPLPVHGRGVAAVKIPAATADSGRDGCGAQRVLPGHGPVARLVCGGQPHRAYQPDGGAVGRPLGWRRQGCDRT